MVETHVPNFDKEVLISALTGQSGDQCRRLIKKRIRTRKYFVREKLRTCFYRSITADGLIEKAIKADMVDGKLVTINGQAT